MGDTDDDFDDTEWCGRPQDDPHRLAMLEARRQSFRAEHPLVDCWVYRVQTIELFLGGVRRVLVETTRALMTYFNPGGAIETTAIYLRSENPFDLAEAHLGIDRILEIRDESNDAEQILSSYPREYEERSVDAFRRLNEDLDDEILRYLRSVVRLFLHLQGNGDSEPRDHVLIPVLAAVRETVQGEYEAALVNVDTTIAWLAPREMDFMFAKGVLQDSRRAGLALGRRVAAEHSSTFARRLSALTGQGRG
ncbi:hypothetical protein Xaut_0525 [Xanthobacter versatilis]|uniref:Uncharacterized protein n=1 Tax=Xanthobacter autotrophicus (strain ATCC BAA-1158 / Py2) TaxID=78245 RepID=A7ICN9_XANP2|nr:hypothetical protein Xaut_0525 [Xanthobacter autotrophicus Py2]